MDNHGSPALHVGQLCKFTGGPLNGFTATIAKLCDAHCSVTIIYDNQPPVEVITETQWLTPIEPSSSAQEISV